MHPEAFFLSAPGGASGQTSQRLCLYHAAQGPQPRGRVVYIHPFAEEMNKSRRMAALQARALAQAGFSVLQIDLLGCGDSSGDFGDASWQAWVDDVLRGCAWLDHKCQGPLWLWGLRGGCLLAVAAARAMDQLPNFLFWAPSPSGTLLLQQFLRLKVAGDMLAGGAKGVMQTLRRDLQGGAAVEVAGYMLAPALASGLDAATLAPPTRAAASPPQLLWFEVSNREPAEMTPAAARALQQWRDGGCAGHDAVVPGPAFWQTSEIEEAPALIDATTAALLAASPADRQQVAPA